MKFTRIDVRFFRSFNYDFERKVRKDAEAAPWEDTDPGWFPFVRVDLAPDVTAVVGANESGKSQLLVAIRAALTGKPIDRADFCRYSELYSAQQGEIRLPQFGVRIELEASDNPIAGVPQLQEVREFGLYRPGSEPAYLVVDNARIAISVDQLNALQEQLPKPHILQTDLALPDNVSIAELAGNPRTVFHDRKKRIGFLGKMLAGDGEDATIKGVIAEYLQPVTDDASLAAERRRLKQFELARKLLVDVAKIAPSEFETLAEAIQNGREGQVEAITGAMNAAIKENLNFQRWWTQDRDFDLLVEAREQELAFTIRDRTNSTYSFQERSQGLRYFLSYFVQLTAHRMQRAASDILLLDEPDAFLSSVGQQDLLRVLQDYAIPEDANMDRSQVVYVTHSPFLIDKNAPQRIRVLDKGSDDAGTRVVRDAANNRYEPLRSALGQSVSETAFIGGANLFVEGPADQILLSAATAALARRSPGGVAPLDLNKVTVVSCGGADAVPYMVYLARGRDTLKPPCVALLDSDTAGEQAYKLLLRGEVRKKKVLAGEYVVLLGKWANENDISVATGVTVREPEDLLPVELARHAALNYLARFGTLDAQQASEFTIKAIEEKLAEKDGSLYEALEAAYLSAFPEEHLEKAGLAREVSMILSTDQGKSQAVTVFLERFGPLLECLASKLDDAFIEEGYRRLNSRLDRAVNNFLRDFPSGIRKVDAKRVIREIDIALDDTDYTDQHRVVLMRLRREFGLEDSSKQPEVPNFDKFREEIKALGNADRAAYQDDATKDPLNQVEPPKAESSTDESVLNEEPVQKQ